ncbi:hypothetical protein JL193_07420 [Polaribacter batillariae]|uniref:Uncharacterized protein n=1 Tax=Polaribacter batillariae TaxID=2808900 RepID=A0ABX7SXT9_9FLAO|nr:hypothetical protein [Polaribacter batillariae]QTD39069.1 hypothetical protein JL193_07420 [Polaribacter batillariae]
MYTEIEQKSTFKKSITILFILIFAIIPLAEIVIHLEYNSISYFSIYPNRFHGLDHPFEVLSFKAIK